MREQEQSTDRASEFVEAVRRSGLVAGDALDAALRAFDPTATPADAESAEEVEARLAKHLIECNLLTRYQAKELLQGRFRRLRMGQFVIRDLLGVGGMGAVFRAYDERRQQDVALKVLSERFKHDAGMRARFRLEARAGMRLEHPGIVKTLEIGVTDDVFGEVDFTTMNLFEGIALHELVGIMGPIPVNAACDMICQAAEALEYLHAQGMVHRDVKPDNLLIDREGNVKLIDFGLTLIDEAVEGEEFSLAMIFGHDCLGTPDYMAPEQATDSHAADRRADVYSLGCTLFVALTGKRPFYAKTGSEVIHQHKTAPPPDPRSLVPGTPPEVSRAVMRMMAKSPGDRFQTMSEVREALRRFATKRRIEFSFSRLIRNRMALAIKQGRISQRRTSTAMRLSSAGRLTRHPQQLTGATGSAAALQATDAPRDTTVSRRRSTAMRDRGHGDQRVSETAAGGAEVALRDLGPARNDQLAAASGAMLRLPDGGLYRLAMSDIVIGRSRDDVDLWIDDRRLSGRHCRLTFDGQLWQVIDLDSRNGTEINRHRIGMAPLFGKDRLTLGGEVTLTMDWSRGRPSRRRSAVLWTLLIVASLAALGLAFWSLR